MICSYCGKNTNSIQRDHVFPKCLYPLSKANSKIQRLTIPACNECNNGWADDEAHFRDVLAVAGDDPNFSRNELFNGTVLRSFEDVDGQKRIDDLLAIIKPVKVGNDQRRKIYPAEDERVLRVVRKVIRGLSYYHKLGSPIQDERIWVDVLRYSIPDEYVKTMQYHHREKDIADYLYSALDEDNLHSVWIIRFFESVIFVGLVSQDENNLLHPSGLTPR